MRPNRQKALGRGALFATVLVASSFVYLPTLVWLVRQWLAPGSNDGSARDWSHGGLVVLLIGYSAWRQRQELPAAQYSLWGMPLMLMGLSLHLGGVSLQLPYLSAYSIIPLLLGSVYLLFGLKTGNRLITPSLLFILAVPFPAAQWGITNLLQQAVATGSTFLASLLGAPVARSGLAITVGEVEYLVEPLCSGFNLIMALLALGVPLLYLRGATWKYLGAALLWLPALGLATKVLLVSLTLALTPNLGQERALSLYHGWLGIAFFLISLTCALAIIKRPKQQRGGSLLYTPGHNSLTAKRTL